MSGSIVGGMVLRGMALRGLILRLGGRGERDGHGERSGGGGKQNTHRLFPLIERRPLYITPGR